MKLRPSILMSTIALSSFWSAAVLSSPFDSSSITDNYSQYFGAVNVPKDTTIVQDKGNWKLIHFNKGGEENSDLRLNHKDNGVEKSDYTYVYTTKDQGTQKFQTIWTVSTLKAMLTKETYKSLRKEMGMSVSDIRSAVNEVCPPLLEVGKTSVYRAPFDINGDSVDYIAELDSNSRHCNGSMITVDNNGEHQFPLDTTANPANVRIKTIVPTVPGAIYTLQVKYQQRATSSRDVGDLVVRVGGKLQTVNVAGIDASELDWEVDGQRAILPTEPSNRAMFDQTKLESGFYKGTITFKATRFYTPVHFRDNGLPDAYGILLRGTDVDLKQQNPAFEWCSTFFKPNSKNLKACLEQENPEQSNLFSCSFEEAIEQGRYSQKSGTDGTVDNVRDVLAERGDKQNFYIVGLGGKLTVNLPGAGCQIHNKSISINEFTNTWGSTTFPDYAEQGTVKAVLRCLNDEGVMEREIVPLTKLDSDVDSSSLFKPKDRNSLLRTNQSINFSFDEDKYSSCRLVAVNIKDTTSQIVRPDGNPLKSKNGFEVQGLAINE